MFNRLIAVILLVMIGSFTPAYAIHTTVGSFASLPANPDAQDTAYGIQENRWVVSDGTNWIPCENGNCALANLPFCHPSFTTTIPIIVSGATLRTELVAETANQKIRLCSYDWGVDGTGTVQLVYGTTTTNACDTGAGNLTGAYSEIAQTGRVLDKYGSPATPTSNKLCMVRSAAIGVAGSLTYRKTNN